MPQVVAKKKKVRPLSVFINIRAKSKQRDIIDQAAEALGKSRSEFMLESSCREAETVLLDRRFFQFGEKDYRRFVKLLDAPPAPNVRLKKLLASPAPWK